MRAFLLLFISFLSINYFFGQNGNSENWDHLIENEQFDQLKSEFQKNDKSEYSYINFLRSKAFSFSQRKEDKIAIKIMLHCCSLANNKYDDCDTIKLNNLHLLGRYYLISNELDLSLKTNKICLNKRLSCKNVDPIDIAKSFNNIGTYYLANNLIDSSLIYFDQSNLYLNRSKYNNSLFSIIFYRNYLNALTKFGQINKGVKVIKKWSQVPLKSQEKLELSTYVNGEIYNLLRKNDFKGALKYLKLNQNLIISDFGKNSNELLDNKLFFSRALGELNFNSEAYKYLKEIDKKHSRHVSDYVRWIIKNSTAVVLSDMGRANEAINILFEIKPKLFSGFPDSTITAIVISNLSLYYKNIGDFEKMRLYRNEFYDFTDQKKYNPSFNNIYNKNLERDLQFFYEMEDFLAYEQTLIESIKFKGIIGKKDLELHEKLKLSNLYLFQKPDFEASEKLLKEVKRKIPFASNQELLYAYYNYYYAEFLRRNGYQNENEYYKKAYDIFDSIKVYPVEYENSLKKYAEQKLKIGDIEHGKFLLDKYMKFGDIDSNSINSFLYKIDYLTILKNYQTDEMNDINATELLNQIERIHGINNSTYRKAAKFLNDLIIDYSFQKNTITKWINSFDSKNNLDYYFAKSALGDFYFENGELSNCDSTGEIFLKEAEILKIEDYKVVAGLYISNLVFNLEKGFNKSISLLDTIGIGLYDFEKDENRYYFLCLMGLKDYSSVIKYLNKKEGFIISNYTENSEPYFLLLNDFITYYQTIGNANLEKYFREKELGLLYKYQPNNKRDILSKTVSLGISYGANFNVYDYTENLINKVKSKFTIEVEKTEDINELLFIFLEIYSKWGKLMTGDKSVNIIEIQNNLTKLQDRCISLKSKGSLKIHSFILDLIINFSKFLQWDGGNESLNEKATAFFQFFQSNNVKIQDLSEIEIRKLISEGKTEEAEKLALSKNNFLLLSEIEYEKDNIVKSFDYSCMDQQQNLDKIILNSNSLSEVQLEESRRTQKNFLNFSINKYLLNLANYDSKSNKPGNFKIMKKSFELILNNYGVLSEINRDLYEYIRNSDSSFKNQFYYLSKYNNQKLMIQDGSNLSNETIREIEYKVNLTMFDRERSNSAWVTFEDIQKSLDDSTVFVLNYKFVYNGFDESLDKPKTETYYLTFIVEPEGYSPTVFIDSLSVENEEDIVDYYHNGITKKSEKQDLSFVYEKIWSKIDEELPKKVKRVILSPDGMYNSINVSTLFDKNNNKYIFDKYEIIVADKFGAKVVDNASKLSSNVNSAVLVGFPNYSGTTISDKQNTNDTLKINLDKYYTIVTRGSIAKSLPGTKTEIEKINSLFVNNRIKTTVLMENNATEDNLKKALSPDVLHIATHGFFINSKEGTPMLNSGLLLAGSNSKTKKIEDGYLSAYETSLLNLENTKLVVLSACETGRGVMKDGDGVFGLKQGCLNAGAQNIIMSLWKVDDKVTQEFMSRFYEIWLNEKTSIREAFNRTQLEIKAKYPQPYYWGAFILVGE